MFKLKTLNFKNEYLGFKATIETNKQNLNELEQPKLNKSTPTQEIGNHFCILFYTMAFKNK
jgi:hypothetical protein